MKLLHQGTSKHLSNGPGKRTRLGSSMYIDQNESTDNLYVPTKTEKMLNTDVVTRKNKMVAVLPAMEHSQPKLKEIKRTLRDLDNQQNYLNETNSNASVQ